MGCIDSIAGIFTYDEFPGRGGGGGFVAIIETAALISTLKDHIKIYVVLFLHLLSALVFRSHVAQGRNKNQWTRCYRPTVFYMSTGADPPTGRAPASSRRAHEMKNSTKAACLLLAGCLLLACPISSHAQGQNQTSTNGDGQSIEPATNGQATNGNGAPSGPPSTPPPGAGPGAPPPNRRQCRSIATALQSYDFLSTLRAALVAAGMTDTLNEKDLTISFLAPTDAVSPSQRHSPCHLAVVSSRNIPWRTHVNLLCISKCETRPRKQLLPFRLPMVALDTHFLFRSTYTLVADPSA